MTGNALPVKDKSAHWIQNFREEVAIAKLGHWCCPNYGTREDRFGHFPVPVMEHRILPESSALAGGWLFIPYKFLPARGRVNAAPFDSGARGEELGQWRAIVSGRAVVLRVSRGIAEDFDTVCHNALFRERIDRRDDRSSSQFISCLDKQMLALPVGVADFWRPTKKPFKRIVSLAEARNGFRKRICRLLGGSIFNDCT